MSRAIYYPYIRVPQSSWFTRVLLYWDDVGTIAPHEFIEDPKRLGDYMAGLVKEKLVRPVSPAMYLWKVNNFQGAFLSYVDGQPRTAIRAGQPWSRVHMEKLQGLGEALGERGLARRVDEADSHSSWFELEPETAAAFMSYLAAVLGQLPDETPMCPVTDQEREASAFLGKAHERKALARKIILEGVLPGPVDGIEPAQLAEFKSKYQRDLSRFRNEIENRVGELALIKDDDDLAFRQAEVVKYLQVQLDDVVNLMREQKKWPNINLGTLCGIGAAGLSSWQAIANGDPAVGLAGTALSLVAAVCSAFQGSNLQLHDKPMAYAALVNQKVG